MSLLDKLKKTQKNSLENIKNATASLDQKESVVDPDYWYPGMKDEKDPKSTASHIIRFLPSKEMLTEENAVPWVRYFQFAFQGPTGKWYNEMSLQSLNQKDPAATLKSRYYNEGKESLGKPMSRKELYVANILVINDTVNPENNGKVKKFKFGKKIFEKLKGALTPDPALNEEPLDVFDVESGANLKIVIKMQSSGENDKFFRNYDQSTFAAPSAIKEEDVEKALSAIFPLAKYKSQDFYKSYEELEKRLNEVMGIGTTNTAEKIAVRNVEKAVENTPSLKKETVSSSPQVKDDDDDVDISAFLANIDLGE